MKQVYLSLLLAGLTAAPALGQKTTVNAFPKPLAPVANAGMKAPQFHLPSAIDDKKRALRCMLASVWTRVSTAHG